jgi:ribosome biogenesis GTPase A
MAFKGTPGGHHEPYWDLIKRIITESDLVLEILDARLVELSRNEEVERLIAEVGRPMIFVINKTDLVSMDKLIPQVNKLREKGKLFLFPQRKKVQQKYFYIR